jgi:hypothetical protein
LPRRRPPQLGRLYRLKPSDIAEIEALRREEGGEAGADVAASRRVIQWAKR